MSGMSGMLGMGEMARSLKAPLGAPCKDAVGLSTPDCRGGWSCLKMGFWLLARRMESRMRGRRVLDC